MFRTLTLRGVSGSLNWGYRSAATLTGWSVRRVREDDRAPWRWELEAGYTGPVDSFSLRQRPLLFTAPRRGGFWCWPVQTLHVGETRLIATLGPPEY